MPEKWAYPCKYDRVCEYYDPANYHCVHGGGTACAEWCKLTDDLLGGWS